MFPQSRNEEAYPKLRALQNLRIRSPKGEKGLSELDGVYEGSVHFTVEEKKYKKWLKVLKKCNERLEEFSPDLESLLLQDELQKMVGKPSRKPTYNVRQHANMLFEVLAKQWHDCTSAGQDIPHKTYLTRHTSQDIPHKAKLQLYTTKRTNVSDELAEFDVVFSTHSEPRYWKDSTVYVKAKK